MPDKIMKTIYTCFKFFIALLIVIILVIYAFTVYGKDNIPVNSKQYLPILNKAIDDVWKDLSIRSMEAGQIEQETCISLTHKKCWNPKAELKTSREYGFGLGQITITDKFNNFEEIKKMDKFLKDWKYEDRYDPYRQLRALVVYDHFIYSKVIGSYSDYDRLAFTLAAYNGGLGGLIQDRQLCKTITGCESNKWFGNVENTSRKSKKKSSGYGKSFFEINREYVSNILLIRRQKYIPYLPEPVKEIEATVKESDTPGMVPNDKEDKGCHWIDKVLNNCK